MVALFEVPAPSFIRVSNASFFEETEMLLLHVVSRAGPEVLAGVTVPIFTMIAGRPFGQLMLQSFLRRAYEGQTEGDGPLMRPQSQ